MRIINLFLVVLSAFSIYIHYLNNESSELQYILYVDMSKGVYLESSAERFSSTNLDFPNLSLSSVPIKSIVARYYFNGGQFNKALEYLNDSDRVNPYLMFSESLRSEVYEYLDIRDSLGFYAKKAFTGIPNNDKHFLFLSKYYVKESDFESLDSIFKIVKDRKNPRIWNIYFSSLLSNESKISDFAKEAAKSSTKLFPPEKFPEIELVSKYVIYGSERINNAVEKDFYAQKAFSEKDFATASKLYAEASELNPTDYTLFENAGLSYYMNKEYDKSLEFLTHVVNSMNPNTGKSEFIISSIYIEKNDITKVCEFANLAAQADYPGSYGILASFCR